MSNYLAQFEARCIAAKVSPSAALSEGGVHPTLWKKWQDGRVSPTLRNFEAAERGLEALIKRAKAPPADPSHAGVSEDTGIVSENSGVIA